MKNKGTKVKLKPKRSAARSPEHGADTFQLDCHFTMHFNNAHNAFSAVLIHWGQLLSKEKRNSDSEALSFITSSTILSRLSAVYIDFKIR